MSTHTRRKRRQLRALLQHGPETKPKHKLKSGRTGTAHSKKCRGRQDGAGVMSREVGLRARVEPLEELVHESASEAVAEARKKRGKK